MCGSCMAESNYNTQTTPHTGTRTSWNMITSASLRRKMPNWNTHTAVMEETWIYYSRELGLQRSSWQGPLLKTLLAALNSEIGFFEWSHSPLCLCLKWRIFKWGRYRFLTVDCTRRDSNFFPLGNALQDPSLRNKWKMGQKGRLSGLYDWLMDTRSKWDQPNSCLPSP